MLVLGISGYAACGKSEAARYLRERHNFEIFEISKEIEEEAQKLGLLDNIIGYEERKRKLSEVGKRIREFYGREDIFAIKIIQKIKDGKFKRIVIDGIRSISEYETFKKEFQKIFYLIFITANDKIRYERRKLQDKYFNLTFEEFLERDKRDSKLLGLEKLEELADFIIENNSSLNDFYKKLDLIINSLL